MNNKHGIIGNPPLPYPIYERLFNFMDNVLPNFRVHRKDKYGNLVTSEDAITEDLSDFLDSEQESLKQDPNYSFKFTNQSQKKTDIGVKWGRGYTAYTYNREPFCWVEAKRLPTPDVEGKSRDEREYVIVSQEKINGKKKFKGNGGIQRFKQGKHAPHLDYSIMIGYIQNDNSIDYWFSKINTWITELANANNEFWSNEDCLNKYFSNKCDRFLSIHKRKDKVPITLHHYWIKLNKK